MARERVLLSTQTLLPRQRFSPPYCSGLHTSSSLFEQLVLRGTHPDKTELYTQINTRNRLHGTQPALTNGQSCMFILVYGLLIETVGRHGHETVLGIGRKANNHWSLTIHTQATMLMNN